EMYADRLLEKVFYNLFENAIRHGERVSRICISVRDVLDDVTIVVEDDGVGIPEYEKGKIFNQGYGRNTGYGLFLIREILAITGMTISETGKPGRGARFEIRMPEGTYQFGKRPER
ncbi:MAG: ATP-binding protein, partial [Methanobacteriota archaeon]